MDLTPAQIQELKIRAVDATTTIPALLVVAGAAIASLSFAAEKLPMAVAGVALAGGAATWQDRRAEEALEQIEAGDHLMITKSLPKAERAVYVAALPTMQAKACGKHLTKNQRNRIRRERQTTLTPKESHEQPHKLHPSTEGDRVSAPATDTAQRPAQKGHPVASPSGAVGDRERIEVGMGTVASLPVAPDTAADEATRPVVGRGYQYRPGEGFVADGLVLHEDTDPITARYGDTIASITDMHSPASKPRHLAFLAITQCGKSTTVAAMSYALRDRYPDAQFLAVDMKNTRWPRFFDLVANPGHGDKFSPDVVFRTVKIAYDELSRRVEHELKGDRLEPRMFLVLDEWNMTRDDVADRVDVDQVKRLDLMVKHVLLQGLEFGVHLVMVLQEPNCDKIGLTDAARLNIHFLALARAGELSMVDALLDSSMILKSRQRANQLRGEFDRVWTDRDRHPAAPVIVDSRRYSAEALPDFGDRFDLVKFSNGVPHEAPPSPDRDQPTPATPNPVCCDAPDVVDDLDADHRGQSHHPGHGANLEDALEYRARELFIKGIAYRDVRQQLGVDADSAIATRIHAVGIATEKEIRSVARCKSLNGTAKHFGTTSGDSKTYKHIRALWHEENPPPVTAMTGMV